MNVEHNGFQKYLQSNKLKESTIKEHLQNLKRFKKWCEGANINYQKAGYNDLLKFIQQARKRGVGKSSINMHLSSISKYYEYLIKTGYIENNPAKELKLKNKHKKVLQHLLSLQELEEIYLNYQNRPQWTFKGEQSRISHQRNIVILGLMIFQGMQIPELKKIEKKHLNLLKGTIYIPSSSRSNSRILKLDAKQIIPVQNYLKQVETEQLISGKIAGIMFWLMKSLRKTNNKIKNAQQIRSSVIMNWLKQHNIRQVQYMCGHKYISSTEKYKQEDLEDLQAALNLFHPLK